MIEYSPFTTGISILTTGLPPSVPMYSMSCGLPSGPVRVKCCIAAPVEPFCTQIDKTPLPGTLSKTLLELFPNLIDLLYSLESAGSSGLVHVLVLLRTSVPAHNVTKPLVVFSAAVPASNCSEILTA